MNQNQVARGQDKYPERSICFVQLTRMGDLVQTYRVGLSIKKHEPDVKLYLVARKKFALPLKFLFDQCFEDIFLLDAEKMVANADNVDGLIANVSEILDDINSNSFDILLNLSWSRSSEYICSLIEAGEKKGLIRSDRNQVILEDRWSRLVYSFVMRGDYCPYNIVDIYNSMMGSGSNVIAPKILKTADSKKIVIHPFASHSKKYWKSSKWTEVIYKVLASNKEREVVIVGDESEQERGEQILKSPILDKYRDRIFLETNGMDVNDLLNTIACSELFVGHDSFVSHLAALTDVPIVTLALGSVRVCETAPYSPNAYIISPRTSCYPCSPDEKCDFYRCHVDVPYQVVVGVIDLVLNGKNVNSVNLNQSVTTFLTSSVDVFKAGFKESGFLCLDKVIDSELFLKDIFMTFYRMAYFCFFEMNEEKVEFPRLDRKLKKALEEVMEGLEYVYDLYQFGKTYSKNIIEEVQSDVPCMTNIKSYSDNIDEVERLQGLLGTRYPVLKPMIDFFLVERRSMKGDNVVEISEANFYSYHGSSIFTSIMYELCGKTVRKYEGNFVESPGL